MAASPTRAGNSSPARPTPPCRSARSPILAALLLAATSGVLTPLSAQADREPAATPPAWMEGLRRDVESILPRSRWPRAQWGILAVSATMGDTLYATDPAAALAPASNAKLLTSAAAMDALGPDFRFTTYLVAGGPVVDGVLRGDLLLLGTGDPTFSNARGPDGMTPFERMARAVSDAGIRRVDGSLLADASLFPGPGRAPGWNPRDFNDWFAAPSTSIAWTENVAEMTLSPGAYVGARPQVRVEPEGAGLEWVNEARTVDRPSRQGLAVVRDDPDGPVRIVGEIALSGRGAKRVLTVPDPGLHALGGLKSALRAEGIVVVGRDAVLRDPADSPLTGPRTWAPAFGRPAPRVLAEHRSPPLSEILTVVNQRSHNLYADMVLKALGRIRGEEGSFEGGGRVVEAYAVRTGVPADQVRMVDGSGLSRENRASAGAFVTVLRDILAGPLRDAFLSTLPEAGGQSLRRMQRSAAAGNLRAKTGTIQNVSALSGVVHTSEGEPILFSILANGVPSTGLAKGLEDQIGIRLAGRMRPVAQDPAGEASAPGEAEALPPGH